MNDTPTSLKTAKSEQTKRRIIDAFLALMELKKWDRITVKELCQKSGITRGTFYLYFSDIYELMEQIQEQLIREITHRYNACREDLPAPFPADTFLERFDYEPPRMLVSWFDFCKDHRTAMRALLDPANGDVYFEKKLKNVLNQYINSMMDADGQPHDELRSYFVRIFTELHFLSARAWLSSDEKDFLSVKDIVNLLNTMRVGAAYLSYKQKTSSDFDSKIKFC